jgi:NAD(P)-dependent dehydrogenase (short-subunit alcohol dehydrogenase family)
MMASNYIGPYILTHELLPLLQKNAPEARIVNLVSFTHRALQRGQVDVSQVPNGGIQQKPAERSYYPLAKIYEASKLFLILHAYELHRQAFCNTEPKDRVSVMAADPGFVTTNLLREVPAWLVQVSFIVMRLLGLSQSPTAGVSSVVAAALAPWEVSGKYVFGTQGLFCKSTSFTYDDQLGRSLWEASAGIRRELISKHTQYK